MISALFLDRVTVVTFLALLTWAAVSDYYSYLIPNRISVAVALLFVAHAMVGVRPWIGRAPWSPGGPSFWLVRRCSSFG